MVDILGDRVSHQHIEPQFEPEIRAMLTRLEPMFSLISLETLSGREQEEVTRNRMRFERQMQQGGETYQLYERHVAIVTPQGQVEDYLSFLEDGQRIAQVGKALATPFRKLTTETLLTCGGIGITIGTPETGQWKILAHALADVTFVNALLAIGLKRALEQGARPDQITQVEFETAGIRHDRYREWIEEFLHTAGLHAEIVFRNSPTANTKDRKITI